MKLGCGVGAQTSNRELENGERQNTPLFEGFGNMTGILLNLLRCWKHKLSYLEGGMSLNMNDTNASDLFQ